ncbi:MAG: class I SAM-dependent methyltransferase [Bdellovibrio sp.]|nr:class I SAM-dependent methyltransferase [Bdellovibrio sp.]
MDSLEKFIYLKDSPSEQLFLKWSEFLKQKKFNLSHFEKIDFTAPSPVIYDSAGNKFSIDFNENKLNYHKKKGSIKTELLSRAMGAGKAGNRILDLSAGLAIDAIFLSQLGYEVTALERNPLIYLALENAWEKLDKPMSLKFIFSSALDFLQTSQAEFEVIYFDPMFPEKIKSALPRQEMVLFRHLVGDDIDAGEVLQAAVKYKNVQRVVVKRPIKAPILGLKPHSQVQGKLIRFDLYGAQK